jgi:hypothetical protein
MASAIWKTVAVGQIKVDQVEIDRNRAGTVKECAQVSAT